MKMKISNIRWAADTAKIQAFVDQGQEELACVIKGYVEAQKLPTECTVDLPDWPEEHDIFSTIEACCKPTYNSPHRFTVTF